MAEIYVLKCFNNVTVTQCAGNEFRLLITVTKYTFFDIQSEYLVMSSQTVFITIKKISVNVIITI